MIEYVNEAGEVTMGTNFGEAYDKEWALLDQGRRDGLEEGLEKGLEKGREEGIKVGTEENTKKLAVKMVEKGISIETISEITELSKEEIQDLIKI